MAKSKKILFINTVLTGSTGKICKDLYDIATKNGFECCIAYGRGVCPTGYRNYKIGNDVDVYFHVLKTRLLDGHGLASKRATKNFIKWIENYKPDVIHLHNIHGYYLNYEILFEYLDKCKKKIIWTLHDCWSLTGHCSNFEWSGCEKWKKQCFRCDLLNTYPKSFFDNSKKNYIRKKNAFTKNNNILLVVPSNWLKNNVENSFMRTKNIMTVHNGIDLNIFRKKFLCQKNNKTKILAIADNWNEGKGLFDMIELCYKLNRDKFKITIIGLKNKQFKLFPSYVECKKRTNNVEELVDYYNEADVVVNPTHFDNYPTVNIEAQACGTPVIVRNVGGCAETIHSDNCYIFNDNEELFELLTSKHIKKGKEDMITNYNEIDNKKLFLKYINMYKEV